MSEARVVSLQEMYELDPSIAQLADMPCGFHAYRTDKASDWVIERD